VLGLTGATLLMAMMVGERDTAFAIQWKGDEGGIVDGYTCDVERRQKMLRRPDRSQPRPANANARGSRSWPAHSTACARGVAERGVAVPRHGDRGQKGPTARIMVF
jgi:hypothetical protein